jgi:P-type E1-E2 ATPase
VIEVNIPGRDKKLEITTLLLDLNGTISFDGHLIPGVAERIAPLKELVDIYILTADTFGSGTQIAAELGIQFLKVSPEDGNQDKKAFVHHFNPQNVAAVGNGFNDRSMLAEAGLSIVVIGPEGCSLKALTAADIAVTDINQALDLLLNPLRIRATLRA